MLHPKPESIDDSRIYTLGIHSVLTPDLDPTELRDLTTRALHEHTSQTTAAATKAIETIITKASSILLAEDNPVNQIVAKEMLGSLGYSIDIAENGKEAVEMFANAADGYDIVLMDVQMPVMDGIEATKGIRKLMAERQINSTIVAVTANAIRGDREKYLAAGMDDYLSKPFSVNEIQSLIEKCAKRQAELALES